MESRKASLQESQRLKDKFDGKLPVIVHVTPDIVLTKKKYLVPRDLPLTKFKCIIRSKIESLSPDAALFYFVNSNLPTSLETMGSLYHAAEKREHSFDGFLHISITEESTFGDSVWSP